MSALVGERVHHAKHRIGTVIDVKNEGFEVRVRFDSMTSIPLWVKRADLTFITAGDVHLATSSNKKASQVLEREESKVGGEAPAESDRFTSRKLVEALRLGIVPDDGLALVTEGRAQEIGEIDNWLLGSTQGAHAVLGGYGSGKTHLLRLTAERALEQGFATAFVSVNPAEFPFSKPKRVYAEVARTLRLRHGSEIWDFRRLVEAGLAQGLLKKHRYFGKLSRHSGEDEWLWATGRGAIRPTIDGAPKPWFPALYDYMKAANIYTYLISSLGSLVVESGLGGKGLLVIFDEAESVNLMYSSYSWWHGLNFLNALIACAKGEPGLVDSPPRTDLERASHAWSIPFLYRAPANIKLLFAFTDPDTLQQSSRTARIGRTELRELGFAEKGSLKSRLTDVYMNAYPAPASAYNWEVLNQIKPQTPPGVTRMLVKEYIETMDMARLYR